MSHQSELIETDIDAYLLQHQRKELLRFLTCGSVDDGKSTLIGRLLYDSKMIYEDQLAAVRRDSLAVGTNDGEFDHALLTDGLKAEREQGITIDVAYRYFSTAKRKFIIADTPGHVQYTRNMATGASTCDLAIILIDARKGILEQTRRHSFITSLLGIRHLIVAINKMDLVDYSPEVFNEIKSSYTEFSARMMVDDVQFIPISARDGDNVVEPSTRMSWYKGPTMMHLLETVHIASDRNLIDLRFPVQYVNRPNADFRGYCGTLASGVVRKGEQVMVMPSRKLNRIKSIHMFHGDVEEACAPMSVTLTLEEELDISRGDTIVHPENLPKASDKFDAMLVWMSDDEMLPGKTYMIKHGSKVAMGSVSTLRYRVDVNTMRRDECPSLTLNEIGRCQLKLDRKLLIDSYQRNRSTGAFIMIDRMTNHTVAAGMILDRTSSDEVQGDLWASGPRTESLEASVGRISQDQRTARLGQKPAILFLTGLTGSGKTTLAHALEHRLFTDGRLAKVIDGQDLRLGLNKDLAFSPEDRSENIRRGIEVAKLFNDAGLLSICAFLAPHADVRQQVRAAIDDGRLILIHLAAPMEVCRERHRGDLYDAADRGDLVNFPGVSAPYDAPEDPDLVVPTHQWPIDRSVEEIRKLLIRRDIIS